MTQTADFDHNVFSAPAAEADKATLARFILRSVQDNAASDKEGRPVFKDVEFIEIRIAGNRTDYVCRRATWKDKERFPRHYEAFKRRVEMPEEGTPLAEWAQITRSQAEELSFHNVKTVEQLAAVSDGHGQQLMGFHGLQEKAKNYLIGSREEADKQTLKLALNEKDERIDALESRVNALMDKLTEDSEPLEPAASASPPATSRRRAKK